MEIAIVHREIKSSVFLIDWPCPSHTRKNNNNKNNNASKPNKTMRKELEKEGIFDYFYRSMNI